MTWKPNVAKDTEIPEKGHGRESAAFFGRRKKREKNHFSNFSVLLPPTNPPSPDAIVVLLYTLCIGEHRWCGDREAFKSILRARMQRACVGTLVAKDETWKGARFSPSPTLWWRRDSAAEHVRTVCGFPPFGIHHRRNIYALGRGGPFAAHTLYLYVFFLFLFLCAIACHLTFSSFAEGRLRTFVKSGRGKRGGGDSANDVQKSPPLWHRGSHFFAFGWAERSRFITCARPGDQECDSPKFGEKQHNRNLFLLCLVKTSVSGDHTGDRSCVCVSVSG